MLTLAEENSLPLYTSALRKIQLRLFSDDVFRHILLRPSVV